MSQFTSLNIEQSIGRYLADQFMAVGYKIYWQDTGQEEGAGAETVTLLRDFPPTATLLISQDATLAPGQVQVPAFTVFATTPTATFTDRQGIGETEFEWRSTIRIDGFADTEYQWYQFLTLFKEWFHPDLRLTLYDQEADINSASPAAAEQKIHFDFTQVIRRELDYEGAARYYLMIGSMATFVE